MTGRRKAQSTSDSTTEKCKQGTGVVCCTDGCYFTVLTMKNNTGVLYTELLYMMYITILNITLHVHWRWRAVESVLPLDVLSAVYTLGS